MAGMCKVIIIGNLGRDPEMRYTPDGLAVSNFTVAVNEKVKGEDRTQWFRVTTFGKLAEICSQYLVKGKQVYVEGRLQTSEWEDREGNKRFTLEVIANQMQMLGTKGDTAPQGYQSAPQQGSGYQGAPPYQGVPGSGYQGAPYQDGGYQGHPQQGYQGAPGSGYQQGTPSYQGGGYQQEPPPQQGNAYQGPPPQQGGGYQGDPYQKSGYQLPPQQDRGYQKNPPESSYSEPPYQAAPASEPERPSGPDFSHDSGQVQNEAHYQETPKPADQGYQEPYAPPAETQPPQADENKFQAPGGDMGGPAPSGSGVDDDDIPF